MKKKLIVGFFLTILASSVSFAGFDNTDLSRQSLNVAGELEHLSQSNNKDLCSGDILVASAYVKSASYALSSDKIQSARVSLAYAQTELKEISHNRSYCARLASKTKPYLAKVILIQGELEANNLKHNSDKEGGLR